MLQFVDKTITCIDYFSEEYLWGYGALICIITLGLLLSQQSGWFQITQMKHIFRLLKKSFKEPPQETGTKPLYVFLASLGGCVGIGNLATVAMAVHLGGPGALFWMWVVAFVGMIIKYSEVFLALSDRAYDTKKKRYIGGSMYFVRKAFPFLKGLPALTALLMVFYSIEVYSFNIVKDSFVLNFGLNPLLFTILFIGAILYTVLGGTQRVGKVNLCILPVFLIAYVGMIVFIITQRADHIFPMLKSILTSAWTGHAPIGLFAGAATITSLSRGASAAAFSGDIGVGYNSVIHIDTQTKKPAQQASLALVSIFVDTLLVCTSTMVLVLITGVWKTDISSALMVQEALSMYFPGMHYVMPFIIFILGYSTIVSYLVSGVYTVEYLAPKYGKTIFYTAACLAFLLFSFFKAEYAFTLTSLAGGLLLYIHMAAIYRLRKNIVYDLSRV